ncbi:MAG: Holliday junction branch migration protein RuvA [Candidatus Buchananbacteria bacterium]|nr:Holliday junction branch migration protein RuvA [Candidatus Buchananbacteria bacterium]
MIAYLRGSLKYKSVIPKKDNFIIIDVAGVGYKVYVLDQLINNLQNGQEIELFIYNQVAEAVLDLYGFVTVEELNFFEVLISISGVGPKSALNILQKAKIEDLREAANMGSADILSKVSGIGHKTAQKIVAGLQDKIGGIETTKTGVWSDQFGEALEALVGLGYSTSQVREALSHVKSPDTGDKIREALKILGKR